MPLKRFLHQLVGIQTEAEALDEINSWDMSHPVLRPGDIDKHGEIPVRSRKDLFAAIRKTEVIR